ncbi:MAG TPA: hypothetical protein VEX37_14485 [Thermomicrobiales bacterium]|nr:hypothetical protein [Thermomicrobiales bacterium]
MVPFEDQPVAANKTSGNTDTQRVTFVIRLPLETRSKRDHPAFGTGAQPTFVDALQIELLSIVTQPGRSASVPAVGMATLTGCSSRRVDVRWLFSDDSVINARLP